MTDFHRSLDAALNVAGPIGEALGPATDPSPILDPATPHAASAPSPWCCWSPWSLRASCGWG